MGNTLYEQFLRAITAVSDLMWGPWTLVFIAIVSVYLTVRTGFFQVSHFGYIFRSSFGQIFDRSGDANSNDKNLPPPPIVTILAEKEGKENPTR